jgi:hypothetical protein
VSTHEWHCVVCGATTYCCNDSHALGCGDGGCHDDDKPKIEFCSLDCALELQRRLVERIAIYHEVTK